MLEYFSRRFDESIINERKKKRKKKETREISLSFSRGLEYLGDRESRSRFSGGRKAGEEASKTRNLCHVCIWKKARTKWRTRAVAVTALSLSYNRASFSILPRSFLPCRKNLRCIFHAHERRSFYCVICAVFSGLDYRPRVPRDCAN